MVEDHSGKEERREAVWSGASPEFEESDEFIWTLLQMNSYSAHRHSPVLIPLPQSALSTGRLAHPSHAESLQAAVLRLLPLSLLARR